MGLDGEVDGCGYLGLEIQTSLAPLYVFFFFPHLFFTDFSILGQAQPHHRHQLPQPRENGSAATRSDGVLW